MRFFIIFDGPNIRCFFARIPPQNSCSEFQVCGQLWWRTQSRLGQHSSPSSDPLAFPHSLAPSAAQLEGKTQCLVSEKANMTSNKINSITRSCATPDWIVFVIEFRVESNKFVFKLIFEGGGGELKT